MGQAEIVKLSTDHDGVFSSTLGKRQHRTFSNELLEIALKSSGDSVWYWNVDSGEIKLDESWIKRLGYDPNTFVFSFEWWNSSIDQESSHVFEKALADYVEGRKEHYEIEYRLKTRSGAWIWVWAIGKCIEYKEDGSPLKFIGTHRDITTHKINENKLIELTKNLESKVKKRTTELEEALNEIKTLKGVLPICSNCHGIRDDAGLWNDFEKYIKKHSEAEFTHSICPNCVRELYPDLADKILAESNDDPK